MKATLYGYGLGDGRYEWKTNTYYAIGQNDIASHSRQPDVACAIDLGCAHWLQALDALLAVGERPSVYLPDGSLQQLSVVGTVEPFGSFYGR